MPTIRFIFMSADCIAAAPCLNLVSVEEVAPTHADVPRYIWISPSPFMPDPSAAACVSSQPPNTGVPGLSFIAFAASGSRPSPIMSVLLTSGGSFFMSMPVSLSAPSHVFFLVSSPYEEAPEYSATATPVHLNFKNPFTSRKYLASL